MALTEGKSQVKPDIIKLKNKQQLHMMNEIYSDKKYGCKKIMTSKRNDYENIFTFSFRHKLCQMYN